MRFLFALLVLLGRGGSSRHCARGNLRRQRHRFGEDEPLAHAEREARDMAEVFEEMGDIDRERTLCRRAGRRRSRDALFQTEAQIRELSARETTCRWSSTTWACESGWSPPPGHAVADKAVRRWLEASSARVRVAFIDACESTLARTRGGTPVEVIDVEVDDALTSRGLAVITSTGPPSVARESDAPAGPYSAGPFSPGFVARRTRMGRSHHSRRGHRHAFEHVATPSRNGSVQRPEYRFDLEGVGDVVLTRSSRAAGLLLPEARGHLHGRDVGSGQVVARVEKSRASRAGAAAGRYLVRKCGARTLPRDLVWGGDRGRGPPDDLGGTGRPPRAGWLDRMLVRPSLRGMRTLLDPGQSGDLRRRAAARGAAPRLHLDTFGGYAREREEWTGYVELSSLRAGSASTGRTASGWTSPWCRSAGVAVQQGSTLSCTPTRARSRFPVPTMTAGNSFPAATPSRILPWPVGRSGSGGPREPLPRHHR